MNLLLILGLVALPIGEVRVLPSGVDANLIISLAELNPDMPYSDELASKAVRRLYSTGYFDYVAVDTTLLEEKVQVTIQVEQPPRLERIDIVGNRRLKTKAILKELEADSGTVLTARQLFDWERKIREQYKKKNYLLAKVSTKLIEGERPGYAVARIEIEEGRGVKISSISFEGNENVSEQKLKRKMKNRSRWFIIRSGRFDEKKFKEDIERIEAYYHDRGWIDSEVTETDLPIDSLGNLDIVMHIDEGRRYYTGNYSFDGREVIAESTLTKAVVLEEAKPYSLTRAQVSLERIRRAYWEQGYIYAVVDPLESLREDTVDVLYRIREGEPARVRRVVIGGNRSVRENVIRRQIILLPGSIFKYSKVERSQRNIFNLALFSDVRFYPEPLEEGEPDIDLVFVVEEKQSGQIGAGVTFNASEGITGYVKIAHPNVFGGAENGRLLFEKGTKKTQASIGLTEPWLFDTPILLGGDLYYTTRQYDLRDAQATAYNKRSLGGSVQTSTPLPLDYTRGGVTLRVERVFIDSVRNHPFPSDPILGFDPASYPKTTISATFGLVRDSRDYFINPSSGSYFSESIEFAGGPLGGDINFIKEILDVHIHFPIAWERRIVLTQKMRLGYVTGYTAADTVPLYERFRPGGTSYDGFVRGYDDLSLGTVSGGALLGGRAMTVFNTELKVKVIPQLALIAFFDAGNAWERIDQVNLSELKKGVGAGIRFEIPFMGVLGFDAGFGLDYPKGTTFSQAFRPHFQISRTF
ncbi:outer membrane protein assembly factor BamA [candidate division TA06 bacterium B3_TA06]|uniref:Outer membrane protein assembly factor BamA n=1 Tax=candidate division TA06 bacterium B3_TA06 TaxID=2012487 RepID=A0A532VB11_UNCT6|nr:MAG: outer membrane protein assembly factor BamA [candidate division TA06 bacterium B3_TA06]